MFARRERAARQVFMVNFANTATTMRVMQQDPLIHPHLSSPLYVSHTYPLHVKSIVAKRGDELNESLVYVHVHACTRRYIHICIYIRPVGLQGQRLSGVIESCLQGAALRCCCSRFLPSSSWGRKP